MLALFRFCLSALMAFLLAGSVMLIPLSVNPVAAREISKAGQVYKGVKNGVVTVFASVKHGSGSLVDKNGLILTNNHVIREIQQDLRVKFLSGQTVKAVVLAQDRANDLAVLWVNLEQASGYTVLEVFTPTPPENLVEVGEKILAIGTPIERETLQGVMTTGIVSKSTDLTIRHDASLNGGNSGGPLFNYDGQIVGVNTFVSSSHGPAISGSVPITKALPLIERAKEKLKTLKKPSGKLLEVTPPNTFPVGQILRDKPGVFKKRKAKAYAFRSRYFDISVLTPPQQYRTLLAYENRTLKKRRRRARRKHFKLSEDEENTKNIPDWNYLKPVVSIVVFPRPKLTTASKVVNTVSLLAAAGIAYSSAGLGAPLLALPFKMGKAEIQKDFLRLHLIDGTIGKSVCDPIETGRQGFSEDIKILTNRSYSELIDKSYTGYYTFNARCFEKPRALSLIIETEGDESAREIRFPNKIRRYIVNDFEPYWRYVESLEKAPEPKPSVENTEKITKLSQP